MRFHPFIKLALNPAAVTLAAPADLSATLGESMYGGPSSAPDRRSLGAAVGGSGVSPGPASGSKTVDITPPSSAPVQLGDIPPSLQIPFSPFMPGQDYAGGTAPSGGGGVASPKPGVGTAATGLSTQDVRSSGGGQPFASAGLTAPHTPVAPPTRPDMRPDIDPNMSVEDRKRLYTPIGQQPSELHTNKVDGGVVIDGKYGTGTSAPIGSQGFKDYARYSDPNRPAGAMPKNMGPASQYAGMSAPPQTGPAQTGPAQLATNQPTAQAFAQDAFKALPGVMNVSQSAAKPSFPTVTSTPGQIGTPGYNPFTPQPAAGGAPPTGVAAAFKPPAATTPSIKPTPGAAPMKVNHTMS